MDNLGPINGIVNILERALGMPVIRFHFDDLVSIVTFVDEVWKLEDEPIKAPLKGFRLIEVFADSGDSEASWWMPTDPVASSLDVRKIGQQWILFLTLVIPNLLGDTGEFDVLGKITLKIRVDGLQTSPQQSFHWVVLSAHVNVRTNANNEDYVDVFEGKGLGGIKPPGAISLPELPFRLNSVVKARLKSASKPFLDVDEPQHVSSPLMTAWGARKNYLSNIRDPQISVLFVNGISSFDLVQGIDTKELTLAIGRQIDYEEGFFYFPGIPPEGGKVGPVAELLRKVVPKGSESRKFQLNQIGHRLMSRKWLVEATSLDSTLKAWNDRVATPHRDALIRLLDTRPSFVPRFKGKPPAVVLQYEADVLGNSVSIVLIGISAEGSNIDCEACHVQSHSGNPLDFKADFRKVLPLGYVLVPGPRSLLNIEVILRSPTQHQKFRIGGIDAHLSTEKARASRVHVGRLDPPEMIADITVKLAGFQPASVIPPLDTLPGCLLDDNLFQTSPPLIAISESGSANEFDLETGENLIPGRDRTFESQILAVGQSAVARHRYLSLQSAPFFVSVITEPSLVSEGGSVAIFNDAENRWDFFIGDAVCTAELPPQVLGEDMERHLDDPVPGKESKFNFRFGVPTKLEFQQRRLGRNFSEPPWNFMRIMNRAEDFAPGAFLERAEYEFLYGLVTTLENPSQVRDLRTLRISELGATVGPIAGLDNKHEGVAHRWFKALYTTANSRSAIIEVSKPGFGPGFDITTGLTFRIRTDAKIKDPLVPTRETTTVNAGRPRVYGSKETGFARAIYGGVLGGFESKNLLEDFLKEVETSHTGRISAPAFGPFGGYGEQEAIFRDGLVRVTSLTVQGRVHRYTLERFGRISIGHHRAKHVLVYERAVYGSNQFRYFQDPLHGIPALRKVAEYVDVIDEFRPAVTAAGVQSQIYDAGCYLGKRFITTRIPVDSTWGEDISSGWKVPLWNRGADQIVYPMPQVQAIFGQDPTASGELGIDLDDIDHLYFYTLIGHGGDIEAWPSQIGLDTTAFKDSQAPSADCYDAANKDAMLPPDNAIDVTLAPFTFRLQTSARPVNLTHGRSAEAMAARLDTITISRGQRAIPEALEARIDSIEDLQKALQTLVVEAEGVLKNLPVGILLSNAKSQIDTQLDSIILRAEARAAEANAAIGKTLQTDPCAVLASQIEIGKQSVSRELDALLGQIENLWKSSGEDLAKFRAGLGSLETVVLPPQLIQEQMLASVKVAQDLVAEVKASAIARLEALNTAVLASFEPLRTLSLVDEGRSDIRVIFGRIPAVIRSRANFLPAAEKLLLDQIRIIDDAVAAIAHGTAAEYRMGSDALRVAIEAGSTTITDELDKLSKMATELCDDAEAAIRNPVRLAVDRLTSFVGRIEAPGPDFMATVRTQATAIRDELFATIDSGRTSLCAEFEKVKTEFGEYSNAARVYANQAVGRIREVKGWIDKAALEAAATVEDARKRLEGTFKDIKREVSPVLEAAKGDMKRVIDANRDKLKVAESGVRLLRAFGDPPRMPGLEFNREKLGYYFIRGQIPVDVTPCTAWLNRVGDELKGIGLRVPTKNLLEQITPHFGGPNFSLGDLIPDCAGLRFDKLFRLVPLPALPPDQPRITRGVDKLAMRAWVRAELDVRTQSRSQLFQLGPLQLSLDSARFQANSLAEVGLSSGARVQANASIDSDWVVHVAGQELVRLQRAAIRYDDRGDMKFDLNPKNIRFTGLLGFMGNLLSSLPNNEDEDGPFVEILRREGLPCGIKAGLRMRLPDTGAGVFAISNLRLALHVGLEITESADFGFSVGFALATRQAPCSVNILFLGGGGWFEVTGFYCPSRSDQNRVTVSLGIAVSAVISFSLGPISGIVGAFIGIGVDLTHSRGGTQYSFVASFGVFGRVQVLGFISVSIGIYMELRYEAGALIGRGQVSIKVKICWCFTLSFSAGVTYRFGSGGGSQSSSGFADALPPKKANIMFDDRKVEANEAAKIAVGALV